MRKRLGFRDVVMWIAVYVAIGAVAWGTPPMVFNILLIRGTITGPWLAGNDWTILLHYVVALVTWGGGCVVAAIMHRRAWLAGAGPVVAMVVGGVVAEVILALSGANHFRGSAVLASTMCAVIPAILLVPYCVSIPAMRKDDVADGVCRRCGYSMAGLTGRVCPECGASVANDSGSALT